MDEMLKTIEQKSNNRPAAIDLNEIYQLFQDLPLEIAMFDLNGTQICGNS